MRETNTIGSRIARARKDIGISQETLAERLNVTRQTISNWEGGRSMPDIEMLKSLSAALEVPVEKLIYGEGEAEERPQRIPNAVGRLCFGLAVVVYILGFISGISGCAALGEDDVRGAYVVGTMLPAWFAGFLAGSVFLALSEMLRLLSIRRARDHSLQ